MRIFILIALLVSWVSAQPSISGISGTIADGQSITITGTDFGTKTEPKPLVWADFSTDINPSSLGLRTTWDDNEYMQYTASAPSGAGTTHAAYGEWNSATNPTRSFSFGVLVTSPNYYNKIYTFGKRLYTFPATSNQKMWRLNPDSDCGLGDGCGDPVLAYSSALDWFSHLNECDSDNPDRFTDSHFYTPDAWMTQEFMWKFEGGSGLYYNSTPAAGTGIMYYVENGTQIFRQESWNNCLNRYSNLRLFDNFTPANTPTDTPAVGERVYMTYLYADSVYNRVIIGNHGTLAASDKRMVVIPTAWSSTSITGVVTQADFGIGDSVYFYVYDGNDSVSSGYGGVMASSGGATPATITAQPVSDTVTAGQSATFFVTASGSPTYQWYRNDSLIAGATNDTFSYTARTPSDFYKKLTDKIYCLLTTDTTISTTTVYLTIADPIYFHSKATQKITINHYAIGETNTHFLYQKKIPRIGKVAQNVDSANDVAFTNLSKTSRFPRWVVVSTDTIYLYADIPVSATVDSAYILHYGKGLSEVNASATFTNCGITNYFGFNDGSGASSVLDIASSGAATVTPPATIGGALTFDGCATFTGNASQRIEASSELVGTGARTISAIIRPTAESASLIILDNGEMSLSCVTSGSTKRVYYTSNAPTYLANTAEDVIANNTYLLTVTRTITGAAVMYINAAQKASGASGTPAAGTNNLRMGISTTNTGPFNGSFDEVYLSNDVKTLANETSRYNMLFNSSTFSTLSNVQSVSSTTGSRRSGNRQSNMGMGMH